MDASHTRSVIVPRLRWIALSLGGLLFLSALAITALGIVLDVAPRYRVLGRVDCEGRPVAHAVVVFHPLDQPLLLHPQAITDAEGRFELRTPLVGDGAPVRKYAVTVAWRPSAVEGEYYGPGANAVAKEYAHPRRTPIHVLVAPTTNQLPAWQVPSPSRREE